MRYIVQVAGAMNGKLLEEEYCLDSWLFMIFLNESICDVEERKQQIKTKYRYLYQFISKSLDSYQIKFYSVYSRKIYATLCTDSNWRDW